MSHTRLEMLFCKSSVGESREISSGSFTLSRLAGLGLVPLWGTALYAASSAPNLDPQTVESVLLMLLFFLSQVMPIFQALTPALHSLV